MLGAWISICVFLITVCGILLLKPESRDSIRHYSDPPAVEERKKVALKMAKFLEENPKIVQQKKLSSLPLSEEYKPNGLTPTQPSTSEIPASPRGALQLQLSFQGEQLEFKSHDELNRWVYAKAQEDPVGFLTQIQTSIRDQPELYIDTLQKVSEINHEPNLVNRVKSMLLEESRNLIQNQDGHHQQMMQKALQIYLNLESDRDLGKKTVDEILKEKQPQ